MANCPITHDTCTCDGYSTASCYCPHMPHIKRWNGNGAQPQVPSVPTYPGNVATGLTLAEIRATQDDGPHAD